MPISLDLSKLSLMDALDLAILIEEEVLPETCRRMVALLKELVDAGKIAPTSRIYFVDDGSRDKTWQLIESFTLENLPVVGIKLSRNRGHQNALLAGLMTAGGDADLLGEQFVALACFLFNQDCEVEGVHEAELGQV